MSQWDSGFWGTMGAYPAETPIEGERAWRSGEREYKMATVVVKQREVRMTLGSVQAGAVEKAPRIVLFGVEGVGKSRFGAGAPGPIFLRLEDGVSQLDVPKFPLPPDLSLEDVFDAIAVLTNEKHQYKTLVVDTLDWLEPLVWAFICARDKKKDIEEYGYGKGYVAALDTWREIVAAIENLHRRTGMGVVVLAHSWVKAFKNPAGEDYERYEMKLHARAARLWIEWSDMTAFMDYETHLDTDEKTKRTKGLSTGDRLIHTQHDAAWDAKNRYGLAKELVVKDPNLGWKVFEVARALARPLAAREITDGILKLASEIGGNVEQTALAGLAKAGVNVADLANLMVWLEAKRGTVSDTGDTATTATREPGDDAPAESEM